MLNSTPPPAPPALTDPTLRLEAHVGALFSGASGAAIAAWLAGLCHCPPDVAVWLVSAIGIGVTSLMHWVHARLYHGPAASATRVLAVLLILGAGSGLAGFLVGCASTNPAAAGCGSAAGQTVETCAYALFGTYVVFEGEGARLVQDPTVPPAAKRAVAQADAIAAPLMEQGRALALEVTNARAQLAAGVSGADRFKIATDHLSAWLAQAQPALADFITAVKAAHGS